jgi:hypothetical protein
MIHEPSLRVGRGTHCLQRSAEDHEEGISLGIDLDALVALDGTPQELPMGFEESRVAITRLEQKPCAALDIGEQECHRALGQFANHGWTHHVLATIRVTTWSPQEPRVHCPWLLALPQRVRCCHFKIV